MHAREAARLGARMAPESVGKWPFSLDLVGEMSFWSKTRYVSYGEAKILADAGSLTVNRRPLNLTVVRAFAIFWGPDQSE